MRFNIVVCGGTFDYFHKGHGVFLEYAFSVGERVLLGLTSDKFVRRWKIENGSLRQMEDYEKRKNGVLSFLNQKKVLDRVEIIKIDDIFGPTLSKDYAFNAIIVSENTKKGADIINERRRRLGLKDLKILIAPNVLAEDGNIISSERIRNGEINRQGRLYINPLWLENDLVLAENLREEFRKPFGVVNFNVSKHINKFSLVAAVGDVTTKKFNQLSINQKISVVDFKVRRKKKFYHIKELGFSGKEKVIKIKNPPGTLTPSLFEASKTIWHEKGRIILQILGEEDLSVLPLVLTAPLGTHIFYGQPNQGLVKVEVSEKSKETAYRLVNKFEMPKPASITRGY